MINVSNSFKEELNNDNRDYMCYVDIVLVNPGDVVESYLQDSSGEYILDSSGENINTFFDGVVISLTNENLWSSALSIEESVSNQNSFDIGSVIINKATIVINNIYEDYTSYDFTGAKVTIRIGLQLSNGTIEVVNKGIFYVDSATYNGSLITLECLDSMSKFDKDYSESELIYPATLRQIVQDACSVCGVLYSASIFENDTFIVNERPSDESLTFRQMLNYVGQIACQQFSIDHNDRLIARWYDRDMMDDLYSSPSSVDDSEYHQISSINSQNINQDDVIITGVKVTEFSESTENPGGSYLSGTTGYVIEIKDNKLIPIGKGSGVSTYLGQKLVGMRFRPMELTFQNDPTIEPTDIAEVIDFKGNHFYTFITSTNFTVGNTQTLSCGAESPTRNSASRYSAATQAYTNSKKLVEKEKTERELAVEALNNALSNASGMYTTEERQSDGSVITYLHDKPTLEESQNVIMITSEAIGISNDGGETYPYGLFLTGDLIARLLYVVGINADYINSGAITVADNDGEITFFADTETGRVDIKAYSLTITGKTVEEIANEESETVLNDFVGSVYTPTITNLQNQIDGQIETWFYSYIPTAENYPASEWTTDTEKDKHLGDLFYVVDNTEYGGQAYRWAKIGTDYLWDYVEDTAVVKALADAAAAQDTADQKRRVFVVTPYPPYDAGDLWVGDDTSEMMRCQVSRQSGNYVSTDWIKAVKYTDDTELYNFIQNDYADTIQEIYNSVDQKSETWYQPEDPSLNWTDTESVSLADVSGDSIIDVSGEEIFTVFESEKFKHEGDLWKDSDTNIEYIYKGGTWVEMPIPDAVFDEIDGKAQIFVVQPTPPYNIGDTWFTGTTILVCNTARNSGVFVSSDWTKKDNYTDDSALYEFIEGDYSETIEEIQAQTDQKAETWYQSTDPSSNWTTDEKAGHAGDLWYNTTEQKTYIYNGSAWDETKSTPPDEVFDSIDGKAQIFVSTPAPPYSVGDLWFNSASSDIMTCVTARSSGSFNASDWEKRNKYTDDSYAQEINVELNEFISNYQDEITEIQSQIDKKAETWYQPTDPSLQWTDTESDPLQDTTGASIFDTTGATIVTIYESEKALHDGDLWHDTTNNKEYIYVDGEWQETSIPDDVLDIIDGKAQIFVSTPTPPYAIGDLWFNSATSDIMTCINGRESGSYTSSDWQKRNKYTDDSALNEFLSGEYSETITELKTQADKKAETWYQGTDPSTSWNATQKAEHEGDLWYNTSNQKTYIYDGSAWQETKSTPPDEVFDSIDGKAQIFVSTPTPPYAIGDLWFNSATSDIMTCINSRDNGSYNEGDWQKRNKYTDDTYAEQVENNLNNFSEAVTEGMDNLQTQIDGKIETWYYEHEPTLENEPASGWTTDAEKQKHIGDLFYRQSNGHSYRFMKTGEDEFEWTLIQDSDIQNALTTANNAQDTADNKRRVFVTTPVPPYDIGDLWVQGENPWTDTKSDPLQDTTGASIFDTTGATIVTIYESAKALGDIMRCATARVSGDYNSEDWERASKYTDDTAVGELDESLNQQEVFDRLTNGGTAQGIYMENGQLYINGTYIRIDDLVSLNAKIGGWDISNDGIYKNFKINDENYMMFIRKPDEISSNREDFIGIYHVNEYGNIISKIFNIDSLGGYSNYHYRESGLSDSSIVIDGGDVTFYDENGKVIGYIKVYSDYLQIGGADDGGFLKFTVEKEGSTNLSYILTESSITTSGNMRCTALSADIVSCLSLTASQYKKRIIDTKNYGKVGQYCYEMASPFFGDIGQGNINEKGECCIFLDDVFSETLNSYCEYQVFLQKEGPGDLWVSKKEKNYFIINGTPGLKFAWELKAVQKNSETERLDEFDIFDQNIRAEESEIEGVINEEIDKFF